MSVIVVTGAAGFLGRRVVERLAARGDRVIAIARRPRPADAPAGVDWIVADVLDPSAYEAKIADALEWVRDGIITDTKTSLGLLWWARFGVIPA